MNAVDTAPAAAGAALKLEDPRIRKVPGRMSDPVSTRRGFLGLFAAAPAAMALPAATFRPAAVQDWTTKPVEEWTWADYLAEADHQIAHASGRIEKVRGVVEGRAIALSEPACEEGCSTCSLSCAMAKSMLRWWQQERNSILARAA